MDPEKKIIRPSFSLRIYIICFILVEVLIIDSIIKTSTRIKHWNGKSFWVVAAKRAELKKGRYNCCGFLVFPTEKKTIVSGN